jgi:hypothetical protein
MGGSTMGSSPMGGSTMGMGGMGTTPDQSMQSDMSSMSGGSSNQNCPV